jgi:adenylylsulfate kinase
MFVVWLTGISGSGKTTIANALRERLRMALPGRPVELLDGDAVREFFGGDLGYSRADRIQNIKRIIFAASLLQRNGVPTIVANIAPYYEIRDFARRSIVNYVQVYVKCSLEECQRRDVKGHYARLRRGELRDFVGQDDSYEVPRRPDVIVDTEHETLEQCVSRILAYLSQKGFVGPAGAPG